MYKRVIGRNCVDLSDDSLGYFSTHETVIVIYVYTKIYMCICVYKYIYKYKYTLIYFSNTEHILINVMITCDRFELEIYLLPN